MKTSCKFSRVGGSFLVALLVFALGSQTSRAAAKSASLEFELVPQESVAGCLPDAHGEVRLTSHGPNQRMELDVSGLEANSTLAVFVLQFPHGPFDPSWYQGDVETDDRGGGHARFIGIVSDETFNQASDVCSAFPNDDGPTGQCIP